MKRLRILLLVTVLGAGGYIRLAPSDPAVWHVDLASPAFHPPKNATFTCLEPNTRYAPDDPPAITLAELERVALASPRTTHLAKDENRITWISRSLIWGFPDYTTAQIMPDGKSLCLYARQRFGPNDWGVNYRRLQSWLDQVLRLNEPPEF